MNAFSGSVDTTQPAALPIVWREKNAWEEHAACRDKPVELWFPDHYTTEACAEAREVCLSCPVRQECAMEHAGERYGIWGGLSPNQRFPRHRRLPPRLCFECGVRWCQNAKAVYCGPVCAGTAHRKAQQASRERRRAS